MFALRRVTGWGWGWVGGCVGGGGGSGHDAFIFYQRDEPVLRLLWLHIVLGLSTDRILLHNLHMHVPPEASSFGVIGNFLIS